MALWAGLGRVTKPHDITNCACWTNQWARQTKIWANIANRTQVAGNLALARLKLPRRAECEVSRILRTVCSIRTQGLSKSWTEKACITRLGVREQHTRGGIVVSIIGNFDRNSVGITNLRSAQGRRRETNERVLGQKDSTALHVCKGTAKR